MAIERGWLAALGMGMILGLAGCSQVASRPDYVEVKQQLHALAQHSPETIHPDDPAALFLDPPRVLPGLQGPQPVDLLIRHALAENRTVQAARYNVQALRYRIPQVTALDDPVVSNTIFPSPNNGLQTADGFMPWNLLIAQQFPWFGTLRLRGEAAEKDVQVALAELAAAELDVVADVKQAYFDLHFNERAERILVENRTLVEDFVEIARIRYQAGQATQQDILASEVVLADLDRERETLQAGLASAKADLTALLHLNPETDLATFPELSLADVPDQIERLYRLAASTRPELVGRRAAVARDARAVDLARQRYRPDITLGFNYGLMTADNAVSAVAEGNDNLGLFVGFNLPIYHKKLAAGVLEAQTRTLADAKLYEAERDNTYRQIKSLFAQAQAQARTLDLFQTSILPRAEETLEVATQEYQTGGVDFLTLITAWREVLQIELQVIQFETEIGKSLAALERAVGNQLTEHPPTSVDANANADVAPSNPAIESPEAPPPPENPSPFQSRDILTEPGLEGS